jgi:hypothetical protein
MEEIFLTDLWKFKILVKWGLNTNTRVTITAIQTQKKKKYPRRLLNLE